MRTGWIFAAAAVTTSWLAGSSAVAQKSDADWLAQCREQSSERYRHCEVRHVALPGGGPLRIDVRPNGGAQVTGWDQSTIAGSARIQVQADSESEAKALAGQIVVGGTSGVLRADGPESSEGRSWSVNFVLSAPRHTDLEIEAINGPIGITGISGQMTATTTNGPISLVEVGGNVRARATNGPLSIVLTGTSWDGEGLDAETRNGPVSVAVPEGYSAELDARTVNGPFRLGIPVTVQGELPVGRVRSVKAPIGAGGAPIRVATTNGPLSIEKR
jgi:DUF4097 and DUF4098 domain-containing protein YvlB